MLGDECPEPARRGKDRRRPLRGNKNQACRQRAGGASGIRLSWLPQERGNQARQIARRSPDPQQ